MNWVGGARNRVKLSDDKKKEQEFFHKKKLAALRLADEKPALKLVERKPVYQESQDMQQFHTLQKHYTKPYAERKIHHKPQATQSESSNSCQESSLVVPQHVCESEQELLRKTAKKNEPVYNSKKMDETTFGKLNMKSDEQDDCSFSSDSVQRHRRNSVADNLKPEQMLEHHPIMPRNSGDISKEHGNIEKCGKVNRTNFCQDALTQNQEIADDQPSHESSFDIRHPSVGNGTELHNYDVNYSLTSEGGNSSKSKAFGDVIASNGDTLNKSLREASVQHKSCISKHVAISQQDADTFDSNASKNESYQKHEPSPEKHTWTMYDNYDPLLYQSQSTPKAISSSESYSSTSDEEELSYDFDESVDDTDKLLISKGYLPNYAHVVACQESVETCYPVDCHESLKNAASLSESGFKRDFFEYNSNELNFKEDVPFCPFDSQCGYYSDEYDACDTKEMNYGNTNAFVHNEAQIPFHNDHNYSLCELRKNSSMRYFVPQQNYPGCSSDPFNRETYSSPPTSQFLNTTNEGTEPLECTSVVHLPGIRSYTHWGSKPRKVDLIVRGVPGKSKGSNVVRSAGNLLNMTSYDPTIVTYNYIKCVLRSSSDEDDDDIMSLSKAAMKVPATEKDVKSSTSVTNGSTPSSSITGDISRNCTVTSSSYDWRMDKFPVNESESDIAFKPILTNEITSDVGKMLSETMVLKKAVIENISSCDADDSFPDKLIIDEDVCEPPLKIRKMSPEYTFDTDKNSVGLRSIHKISVEEVGKALCNIMNKVPYASESESLGINVEISHGSGLQNMSIDNREMLNKDISSPNDTLRDLGCSSTYESICDIQMPNISDKDGKKNKNDKSECNSLMSMSLSDVSSDSLY